LLGLTLATAALFRFWQLGDAPPGLYRDEAFNGLDALGVLQGEHALFFTANNGREPAYIYLTALSTAIFGRSVFAARAAAALAGTLTTLAAYLLGRSWFDRRTGLLTAWIWATTFAAVHLSRIGLRPILLVPLLALTGWAAARAIRQQNNRYWLLSGALYGLAFYTYIAIRFTPLLLGLLLLFAWWHGYRRPLRHALPLFALGTLVVLLPLLLLFWQQPALIFGRAGQVAISSSGLNAEFWRQLLANTGKALALFFWEGDSIVRHNLPGRPLFDPLLAGPFLLGLLLCLRRWRQPAYAAALLWIATMLGPTILAEDTPHFLRVSGIYPAVMLLPALGLSWLWQWDQAPRRLRQFLVLTLAAGSALLTAHDYRAYSQAAETSLLFEAAATDMALQLAAEAEDTAVYLDRWYWDDATQKGWPTIPYLADLSAVIWFRPEFGLPAPPPGAPLALYTWPFGDREFVPAMLAAAPLVEISRGQPARNDLESSSYPLTAVYRTASPPAAWPLQVTFGDAFTLHAAAVEPGENQTVIVELVWSTVQTAPPLRNAFVHVANADGLIGQLDAPPGGEQWLSHWWRPGQLIRERRIIPLDAPFNPDAHTITIGLYDPATLERLPVRDSGRDIVGDSWRWRP